MDILKRDEAIPTAYPAVPSGLSADAAALDSDMIWARIEAYTAHRFTDREVIWTLQGPGCFEPDLTPASITASEIWQSSAWAAVTLEASPLGGLIIPGESLYRFTADIGSGTVPAMVNQAFVRLAEYMAADPGTHGASSYSVSLGPINQEYNRAPTWLAKAMQNSGAGDLLRNYRRA